MPKWVEGSGGRRPISACDVFRPETRVITEEPTGGGGVDTSTRTRIRFKPFRCLWGLGLTANPQRDPGEQPDRQHRPPPPRLLRLGHERPPNQSSSLSFEPQHSEGAWLYMYF